jgi:hypothetical protein
MLYLRFFLVCLVLSGEIAEGKRLVAYVRDCKACVSFLPQRNHFSRSKNAYELKAVFHNYFSLWYLLNC